MTNYPASEQLQVGGVSTLRAWPRGLVSRYLESGLTLPSALERLAGLELYRNQTHNLVVSAGKEMIAALLLDLETVGLTYHAVGTDATAPALGQTALGAEAARKLWTSKIAVGSVITFTEFYLASEAAVNIRECGVFGGAAASSTPGSGTLFSRYLQAYDNSAGLVDLTFEYELTIG